MGRLAKRIFSHRPFIFSTRSAIIIQPFELNLALQIKFQDLSSPVSHGLSQLVLADPVIE